MMVKSALSILAVAAAAGLALAPGVASAATARPAIAHSSSPGGGDPPTTVTFTVTVGTLLLTAPASVNLGGALPGATVSGTLGNIGLTDNRALLSASWTVTAASTAFTTGTGTSAETIPVGDATYDPGTVTSTGTITTSEAPVTLSTAGQTVVSGTAGVGNNSASWSPTEAIAIPASAVGGLYTSTLTESAA